MADYKWMHSKLDGDGDDSAKWCVFEHDGDRIKASVVFDDDTCKWCGCVSNWDRSEPWEDDATTYGDYQWCSGFVVGFVAAKFGISLY